MLGKFFNSFYYGKSGKGDYNPENLPKNRLELFFEVLRVRWSAMVRLNLLYVLFFLPAILWTMWNYLAANNALAMFAAGEITQEVLDSNLLSMVWMWLMVLAPCIAITGPATAGVSYVTRNWARDQHSFMMSDFKDAFKGNWKQALVVSSITGVMPLVVYVCYQFYGEMAGTNGFFFLLPQMLIVIIGFIWLLMLEIIYGLMVTYDLKMGQLLKNAAVMAVGKLPKSVLMRLVTLAIPALAIGLMWFVPSISSYVMLVFLLYYLLFGFVFSRFVFASYSNALFDELINPKIEGVEVNRGLRQLTDDDYEIDPTLPQPKGAEDTEA